MRLQHLVKTFALALVATISGAITSAAEPQRPDIVLFLSDDHTWRDSSVYGSPDIKTPNMERLATAGMTFDNAFVASPSCAPSRAAMLTGLYPARNGAEPNHARPRLDIKKLPAYFQELGYQVVAFGKVGHYRQTKDYGFDIARHFDYHEDVAIPEAIKWLRNRQSDKPLCLIVGTNWPHVPWPEDPENVDASQLEIPPHHVATPESRQWRARYVSAIHNMDIELGKVMDTAFEVLGDDIFFMHTSDHGAQWPFGKWNLYEDGIHTPMIVSWPGHIEPGKRTSAMVSWIDILPTLVDVAGGEPTSDIDGRSFLPVLTGQRVAHRDMIFTTHSGDGDRNVYPMRSVRMPDGWKYIRNVNPEFLYENHITQNRPNCGYWASWILQAKTNNMAKSKVDRYQIRPADELYHCATDSYELRNLAGNADHDERQLQLESRLNEWIEQTGDELKLYGNPTLHKTIEPLP